MKSECAKLRDESLEAALTGEVGGVLAAHLKSCAECTNELAKLRERREQMDALLPLIARGAEPSVGFRARVLAEAQAGAERKRPWRMWVFAGVTASILAAVIGMQTVQQKNSKLAAEKEIAAAQKLAEWRAPSDVLLETPGNAILRTMPKLGESYLKDSAKKNREE